MAVELSLVLVSTHRRLIELPDAAVAVRPVGAVSVVAPSAGRGSVTSSVSVVTSSVSARMQVDLFNVIKRPCTKLNRTGGRSRMLGRRGDWLLCVSLTEEKAALLCRMSLPRSSNHDSAEVK